MFLIFNVCSGKMKLTLPTENLARIFCAMHEGTDYVDVDEEFDAMLRGNESLFSLQSEVG